MPKENNFFWSDSLNLLPFVIFNIYLTQNPGIILEKRSLLQIKLLHHLAKTLEPKLQTHNTLTVE